VGMQHHLELQHSNQWSATKQLPKNIGGNWAGDFYSNVIWWIGREKATIEEKLTHDICPFLRLTALQVVVQQYTDSLLQRGFVHQFILEIIGIKTNWSKNMSELMFGMLLHKLPYCIFYFIHAVWLLAYNNNEGGCEWSILLKDIFDPLFLKFSLITTGVCLQNTVNTYYSNADSS
jgi:hypothetical protein